MFRYTIATLLLLTACNPCEVDFISDTAVVTGQCVIDGTDSGASSDESTAVMTDAATTATTTPPPICVAVPGPGEFWGPCFVGEICDQGECHNVGAGNVCLASCEDDVCEAFKCFNGTCDDDACVPKCQANIDCQIPGTFCLESICVYPAFAPLP